MFSPDAGPCHVWLPAHAAAALMTGVVAAAAAAVAAAAAASGQLEDTTAGLGEYRHRNGGNVVVTHPVILMNRYKFPLKQIVSRDFLSQLHQI